MDTNIDIDINIDIDNLNTDASTMNSVHAFFVKVVMLFGGGSVINFVYFLAKFAI